VLSLILVAGALGLSNFGAAVGIGLGGLSPGLRVRVALVFGAFEAAMPVLGLFLGHQLSHSLGAAGARLGGALLIVVGAYTVWQARRAGPTGTGSDPAVHARLGPLLVTGAALSIDNLVAGFALGAHKVSIVVAALTIAAVSVALSLLGLELGYRLSVAAERVSGAAGGAVLVLVGVAIASGLF
jgi:putative Mn2+ efflux pump MntP